MLARVQARKEQRANKGKARGGSINLRMHNLVRSQVPQKAVFKVAGLEKTRHHEKVAQELIVDASNTDTPYGRVAQEFVIGSGDSTRTVHFAHPMALLHKACKDCPQLGRYIVDCLGHQGVGRVALYMDGTTPGNQMRPDHGRTYDAIYWTIMEFPHSFRSRDEIGWIPFAFVTKKDLVATGTSEAVLMDYVVRRFWDPAPGAPNMSKTGFRIRTGITDHLIRLRFQCFIGDEKSHKAVLSLAGASGRKPCACCMNCVGRVAWPLVSDEFLHVRDASAWQCKQHTSQTFDCMVQRLVDAKNAGMSKTAFADLERDFGIKYEANGLLFKTDLKDVVRVPDCLYWDSQHCLCSSGGVAQYNLNQFLRELSKECSMEQLDEFTSCLSWPRSWPRLGKTFFVDRVNNQDGAHIKAFASEVISAVHVLDFFADIHLRPNNLLNLHTVCLAKLVKVFDLLHLGDGVVNHLRELHLGMEAYLSDFRALYPNCVKIKVHLSSHITEMISRFGVYLNCFGPERRHKWSKAVAKFHYRSIGKALCYRAVNSFIGSASRTELFQVQFLNDAQLMEEQDVATLPLICFDLPFIEVYKARSLTCEVGTIYKNDLVTCKNGADAYLGKVELLLRFCITGGEIHAAVVRDHVFNVGSQLWVPLTTERVIRAECLSQPVIYLETKHGIRAHVTRPF